MNLKIFIIIACLLSMKTVFADQCSWIKKKTAEKAASILRSTGEYLSYCELCDGDKPQKKIIDSVEIKKADENYFEVMVNGQGVDLAYIFVPFEGDQYKNLGKLVKCGASGVSSQIQFPLVKDKKDRFTHFYGRFHSKDDLVRFTIQPQDLHGPLWAKIDIYIISDEWGDSRSNMEGYLQFDKNPHTYFTPFQSCKLFISALERHSILVKESGCPDAIKKKLTGEFSKK